MDEIPFFHAQAAFRCKPNRVYRIYVCPTELAFIWVGRGLEGVAGAAVGGKWVVALVDPSEKNSAQREKLDHTRLELLLDDHPKNLRAAISDFDEVQIRPRSNWHAYAYSDHRHQALLHVRHRLLGKYRLGIESLADLRIAITELPRVLGSVCNVEVPWPESEQPCGCTRCRPIKLFGR